MSHGPLGRRRNLGGRDVVIFIQLLITLFIGWAVTELLRGWDGRQNRIDAMREFDEQLAARNDLRLEDSSEDDTRGL